jgi:hypothetical protein
MKLRGRYGTYVVDANEEHPRHLWIDTDDGCSLGIWNHELNSYIEISTYGMRGKKLRISVAPGTRVKVEEYGK